MLDALFEESVADREEVINIHRLTSQMRMTKKSEANFTSENKKKELEKDQPDSLEIFVKNKQESLLNTPQGQNLSEEESNISFLIRKKSHL